MELFEAIRRRRTTNGAFLPDPVSEDHQRLLMELAGRAPSQLNSQPWRFVLVEERSTIDRVAAISGSSMTRTMAEGTFFERYKPYFRFSQAEMDARRDGMLFDKLPGPLKPFTKQVFTKRGQLLMNTLRVPQTLGEENRKLVAGSPLLLGVMLDRHEYRKEELSGFYSVFSMGAAMENVWLATTELGLGIQFVSFPMETPGAWDEIEGLLRVPPSLELMAMYRIGYLPPERRRPAIDWTSSERKRPSQYVFRGTCDTPQQGWDDAPVAGHVEPGGERLVTADAPAGAEPSLASVPAVQAVAPALTGRPWIEQAWRDVVFVHWRVDVSAVAPLLPAGTRPDTLAVDGTDDGATTWVGLICFRFTDTRFPPVSVGSVGDFVEVNVRVYTVDERGRRGVVFLSLDAGKLAPTVGARVATGLPYKWAIAEQRRPAPDRVAYAVRRHGTHLRSLVDVRVGEAVAEPTALETFLTARWGMHVHRAGRTRFWPNEHESWPLHRASVVALRDDLVGAADLPFALTDLEPDSVLYSPGVRTRFGRGR